MNILTYLQIKLNQLSTAHIAPPKIKRVEPRKILLVHAHPCPRSSFSSAIADTVQIVATQRGHTVKRIDLDENYRAVMSSRERNTYFLPDQNDDLNTKKSSIDDNDNDDDNDDVRSHLQSLKWCDTLIFVYPTWWMNTPASLKGFFDRTLLLGETWGFPTTTSSSSSKKEERAANKTGLVPMLTNIKSIVGISTYGASRTIVTVSGDNGRRMISNAIRPIMHKDCTLLWLGLYDMDFVDLKGRQQFLEEVRTIVTDL